MAPQSTPQGWVIAHVGGAPVIVAPASLLLGLLIAGSWFPLVSASMAGLGLATVLGVVVATVLGVAGSVLLHELAHGLTGTLLGRRPNRYELYLWGGRTSFGPGRRWAPWKDVLVSLAGPLTNLLLWLGSRWVLSVGTSLPYQVLFTLWAIGWVNLALAVFNALPGLPLDGGHAVSALVEQVTGKRVLSQKVAAVGGLLVVVGVAWYWVLRPLLLAGQRPDAFNLVLAVMVAWPIAATSWRVLGLSRSHRAARRVELVSLARPVAVLPATAPLSQVRQQLGGATALVLVPAEGGLLGSVDDLALSQLGAVDEASATAGQVCTVLPQTAACGPLTGQAAVDALKQARQVSRWLVVIQDGKPVGAVPTGAR